MAELDDHIRETWEWALEEEAWMLASKIGTDKASRYFRVATRVADRLLKDVFEEYRSKRRKPLSKSSLNNLRTAEREFLTFAGEEIELREVTREKAREFVRHYLPSQKSPKAPEGQGPATIAKKVTLLRGVWLWLKDEGVLAADALIPWDRIGPSADEIDAAKQERRPYEPDEIVALFNAAPVGSALGDVIRIALLTGCRLEEIASLDASQVDAQARWYEVGRKQRKSAVYRGKTRNARRIVPLVDVAQEIVLRRLEAVNREGPIFHELSLRQSTDKRGGALTKAFTRLRRRVLGEETDRELDLHSFRHTWRTAARRAKIDLRGTLEMGGWARAKSSDSPYDHGLEAEEYRDEQQKVAKWLHAKGYLG